MAVKCENDKNLECFDLKWLLILDGASISQFHEHRITKKHRVICKGSKWPTKFTTVNLLWPGNLIMKL